HFQAQNRYFEDSIHFATSSLWFAPYGLIGWALDHDSLRNGTVALVHARGLFPDGLPFNMPECDALPPARNFSEMISPRRHSAKLFLVIPRRRPDGHNVLDVESGNTRYTSEIRALHDENTGRDEKPVKLARKNVRLLLDGELAEDTVALPIAQIKRDGA